MHFDRSRRLRRLAAIAVVALACAACSSSPAPSPASVGATAAAGTPVAQASPTQPPAPADPTPVPNSSSSADVVVTPDFEPPVALCPGPVGPVDLPGVQVRIGDGQPIAATMGSGGIFTCGTSGQFDVGDLTYPAPLVAQATDKLTFAVDRGWKILWFEEFDHPKRGDGGNLTPGVRVAGGPAEVTIPVPGRTGDMTVGMDMWVARDDGKVVAKIEPIVWVQPAGN